MNWCGSCLKTVSPGRCRRRTTAMPPTHFPKQSPPKPGSLWRRAGVAILSIPLLVVVWWGIDWLHDPQNMPFRTVQFEGEFRHLSARQLEEAVVGYVGVGFFNVDVEAVR